MSETTYDSITGEIFCKNNCSNCHIFESENPKRCPLFTGKPKFPVKGKPFNVYTNEGLEQYLAAVSTKLQCGFHLSETQLSREKHKSTHSDSRFETLDIENE